MPAHQSFTRPSLKTCNLGFFALLPLLLFQPGCATMGTKPASREPIVVQELVKSTHSWDGERLPAYPPGQPEITIRRIRIPAGARLDTHSHPVINAGLLISGELTVVRAGGQTLHLKAGDPIVELVNTPHYGINEGKVPADIVVVYSGAVGTTATVTE